MLKQPRIWRSGGGDSHINVFSAERSACLNVELSHLQLSWFKVSKLIDQILPQSQFFQTGQFIYFGFVKILLAVPDLWIPVGCILPAC